MLQSELNQKTKTESIDLRWTDLYKIGGISCIAIAVLVILSVFAFFIWPFKPGSASTADILMALQNDWLGGLISLDIFMVIINIINILPLIALYTALKRVNESYALIAFVFGLIAVVSLIQARPLTELFYLSNKYASAVTEAEISKYLAAGEVLHLLFNGTAWIVYTIFSGVSGLISALLMLRSTSFSKATAYVGIITCTPAFGFFIPVIGQILLFLGTIGSVVWNVLIAKTFFKLGREQGSGQLLKYQN